MRREFTATVYLTEEEKTLLLYHSKHQKWLPPGGHLEPNETPVEAAIREVKEETGLEVELESDEHLWVEPQPNGRSLERPFLCLLEHIEGSDPHEHIDFIYHGRIVGGTSIESEMLRWFSLEEVEALEPLFPETKRIIRLLLARAPSVLA